MDKPTILPRLGAVLAAALVTFTSFQSIALHGRPAAAEPTVALAQAPSPVHALR